MNISFGQSEYFSGGRPIYRLSISNASGGISEVVLSTDILAGAGFSPTFEAGVVAAVQAYLNGLTSAGREDTKYTISGTTI